MADRSRFAPLIVVAVAAAVYYILQPHWPSDQSIHIVLGDAAPKVLELDVRYLPGSPAHPVTDPELARSVSFRYAEGAAPRIVSHEPRLANGDNVVQMELALSHSAAPRTDGGVGSDKPVRLTVERSVSLQGGTTSMDVSPELLRASEDR